MKALDTILFDLDGTLLPLEQGTFIDTYFGLLAKRVSSLGHDPAPFLKALWEGTGAMLYNDGTRSNSERFWQTFYQLFGDASTDLEVALADFYATDFNETRAILRPQPPELLNQRRPVRGLQVLAVGGLRFPFLPVLPSVPGQGLRPFLPVDLYPVPYRLPGTDPVFRRRLP